MDKHVIAVTGSIAGLLLCVGIWFLISGGFVGTVLGLAFVLVAAAIGVYVLIEINDDLNKW